MTDYIAALLSPWKKNYMKVLNSRFVLPTMLEGIPLPSNMAAKTTFCLYLVKHLIVML